MLRMLSAQESPKLSTRRKQVVSKMKPVFSAKPRHQRRSPRFLISKYHSLASSMTYTPVCLIDTIDLCTSMVFTQGTDQRMVIQSFRFGDKISLTWEMTSDAILDPEVPRPTTLTTITSGADLPFQMLLVDPCLSQCLSTDNRTPFRNSTTGIITDLSLQKLFQITAL